MTNFRIKGLSQELEMAAPPGHGTWNVKLNREERCHSVLCAL